jgi:hypothetical protein
MCFRLTFSNALALLISLRTLFRISASVASVDLRSQGARLDQYLVAATNNIGPLNLFLRGGESSTVDALSSTVLGLKTAQKELFSDDEVADNSTTSTTHVELSASAILVNTSNIVYSDKEKGIFSLFQKGDKSDVDPDGIPDRYLRMQCNRREDAKAALAATLQWRQREDIDHLLQRPQPKFDVCKAVFPHYFAGRDLEDHVIFVQRPALLDLKKAKVNRLSKDELLLHYVYVNEYLWQIAESDKPLGTMTSIIDLTGLNLSIMRKTELIGFVKKFVSTMDSHYPQRAHKTLILNAPKWFNALYNMLSPLLRESTKAKIEIHSRGKAQDKAIVAHLGKEASGMLPASFFSSYKPKDRANEKENVPESDLEQELRNYVSQAHCVRPY